ncbi:MAG: hypothetical protein RIC56_07730 [Pseudomonadales bacterium]
MIELAPLEERLALFAEGIAGRYFHIKPGSEFAGRRITLAADRSALTSDTLYLPESLDAPDASAYRVLALQQLCHREFGTYAFSMATALTRIPGLSNDDPPALGSRASDFERFYHQFPYPALASRLFRLCERVRVDALMLGSYPGIRPRLERLQQHQLRRDPPHPAADLAGVLAALECQGRGAAPELVAALDLTGVLEPAAATLAALALRPGDVHDAAATASALYHTITRLLDAQTGLVLPLPLEEELDDPGNWSQREARLEDWRDDLSALDASLSVEMLDGDEAEAADSQGLRDGQVRPEDLDLKKLAGERDTLARRIDMERSAIRDALGTSQPEARSFRYDEWNYLERRYLPRWCRLFEQRLAPDPDQDLAELQAVIRAHRPGVQKRLEQIKPLGYQRVYRLTDGDELDFNALIQARQDRRAGHTPDDRVYSRRDRVQRDVCAAFLVDLSASTDDPIGSVGAVAAEEEDPFLWGHAAAGADGASPAAADTAEPRRIIDVQREAMLVMSAALEQLGDSYGVYGFSGYGRDCVELFVAKEPGERFSRATLAAIAGMKPKRSTRMGPAIRHAVRKLLDSGNAMKVLMIISDGFPQDCDYGPERGEHEYGVQDTARALQEAQDKGVETFCVTVDRSGHDYLKRMCPEARYLVIEEIEDLPEQLSKVYETLTGR